MSLNILKVKNLGKTFTDTNTVVLKNVNLDIAKGDRVVIIGASGCGKSTLLRCLNCLEDPTQGNIYFDGDDIANFSVDINRHRQKIGMVFQNFNLFNNKTILENITLVPKLIAIRELRKHKMQNFFISIANTFGGNYKKNIINTTEKGIKKQCNENAMNLLKRIGLEDKANVYPSTLSGGQKQRVAIVRALATNPKVMLFDEPTSALDPEMVGEVLELIRELANNGMTMVIVTHEMGFAKEIGSKIVFMHEGKIEYQNEPETFFNNSNNEKLQSFLSKVL